MCIFSSLLVFLVFGCTEDCTSPDENTVKYYGWTVGQQIGHYGVFKSENGGNTWTLSGARSLENNYYSGIFALDENNVWIVGDQGSIYHSTDKGDTWTKLEVPAAYQEDTFNRVTAKSSDDIWIAGDIHLNDDYPIMLHTIDGGTNWERSNPIEDLNMTEPEYFLGIKVFGNSVWAIGGFGEFVIRSADNGTTWEDINITGSGGDCDANDIFLLSETAAYVVKDYGQFYSTNDAGLHWAEFFTDTGTWLVGIAVLDGANVWICGTSGGGGQTSVIKYSANGGTTWQDQTPQLLLDNPHIGLYKIRFIEVN